MQIRRLTRGDEAKACEIVRTFRSSQVGVDYMAQFLANAKNYLIAAYVGEQFAGFVLGYELQRTDGPKPMMLLYEIEVVAEYRRRGIGRALVGQLKQICKERGFAKMFVPTDESNTAAMRLYASTGGQRGSARDVVFWYPEGTF